MNKTLILGVVLGLIALAGLAYAFSANDSATTQNTATCGAQGCPYAETGGCSANGGCGMAGCAASTGGTCGCGR